MQTTQLLSILEDLNRMQETVNSQIQPLLQTRLKEAGGANVDVLIKEIESRFEKMSKPCVEAVSKKVQQKI